MLRSIQYSRTANLRAAACCPTSLEFQKLASSTLTLPSSLALATPRQSAAPRRFPAILPRTGEMRRSSGRSCATSRTMLSVIAAKR